MGGFISIVMGLFGVIWIFLVSSMGGGFFALFGVIFVIIAIVQAIYHFKNATSKNRFSTFDITDGNEEPDPLNEYYNSNNSTERQNTCEDNNSTQ